MKSLTILLAATMTLFFGASSFATTVDLDASKIVWTGRKKVGDDSHTGTIKLKSATIGKDGTTGTFVADMNTINVTDLKGKKKNDFEGHMKSDDFFKVAQKGNDTATLKITSLKDGKAKGEFTMLGKTNPVTFDYTKKGNTYTGKLTLDRTKWGLIYGSGTWYKELTLNRVIEDNFDLEFTIVTKDQ